MNAKKVAFGIEMKETRKWNSETWLLAPNHAIAGFVDPLRVWLQRSHLKNMLIEWVIWLSKIKNWGKTTLKIAIFNDTSRTFLKDHKGTKLFLKSLVFLASDFAHWCFCHRLIHRAMNRLKMVPVWIFPKQSLETIPYFTSKVIKVIPCQGFWWHTSGFWFYSTNGSINRSTNWSKQPPGHVRTATRPVAMAWPTPGGRHCERAWAKSASMPSPHMELRRLLSVFSWWSWSPKIGMIYNQALLFDCNDQPVVVNQYN